MSHEAFIRPLTTPAVVQKSSIDRLTALGDQITADFREPIIKLLLNAHWTTWIWPYLVGEYVI